MHILETYSDLISEFSRLPFQKILLGVMEKPLDSAICASAVLVRFLFRSSNPARRRNPEKRDTRRFAGGTFWRSSCDEGGFRVHGTPHLMRINLIVVRRTTFSFVIQDVVRHAKKLPRISILNNVCIKRYADQ